MSRGSAVSRRSGWAAVVTSVQPVKPQPTSCQAAASCTRHPRPDNASRGDGDRLRSRLKSVEDG